MTTPADPSGNGSGVSWWAPYAALPGGLARDVRFDVVDGRFAAVTPDSVPGDAGRLPGVVLPGFADAHGHAFHRALRGRTHDQGGTFWSWRERMYVLAARLDPDSYLALARATYAELALTGVSTVAEFHYLHHGPDGVPYADPTVMGDALRQAARDAGVRLTLLDTCFLAGGLSATRYAPLSPEQRRFADPSVDAWAQRVAGLAPDDRTRIGAAVHSVRAVPPEAMAAVVEVAAGRPLHVHVSEQPAENEACLGRHGCTPTALLDAHGVLGPATTLVHATHLSPADEQLIGGSGAAVCLCPTTERDLADGIGPAARLAGAGVRLSLGTDQHVAGDFFEEARGMEMDERLGSLRRGRFTPAQLLAAATRHETLGWDDAGRLAPGARADLVAVRLDTVRTAGCDPAQVLLAAGAPDVHTVLVDGRVVVSDGQHVLGDVGRLLAAAIGALGHGAHEGRA